MNDSIVGFTVVEGMIKQKCWNRGVHNNNLKFKLYIHLTSFANTLKFFRSTCRNQCAIETKASQTSNKIVLKNKNTFKNTLEDKTNFNT